MVADQDIIANMPPAPEVRDGAEDLVAEKDDALDGELEGASDDLSTIAGGSALSHASIDQVTIVW